MTTSFDRDAVDRWFLRQGLPHLIEDYRASTDVFTRAMPFLVLVFLFNVVGSFSDRYTGWSQAAVAVGGAAITLTGGVLVNKIRRRRAFQLPDRVGRIELAAFVLVPATQALAFGDDPFSDAALSVAASLLVLGVVYVVVGYGLLPTTVWAVRQTFRHLSQVFTLMGRSLPFVLLFSAFLFLNAEMWQVANDFTNLAFWVVVSLLIGVAAAFVTLRIPREIAEIARFESWARVCTYVDRATAPLDTPQLDSLDGPCDPPLSRADRTNVALVVLFNMLVQIALVSFAFGLFYVIFGVFAVRAETIVEWTTLTSLTGDDVVADITIGDTELVLTVQLLRVVGFLAAFSSLQFAVAAVTDSTYREEFFDEVTGEVREALAVRAVYLQHLRQDRPTTRNE